jgi:cation diffusion facilitator CzcD-associated flavoprotein CzcO
MRQKPTTAVIGAGPSGLAACKVLREHGIPTTCFEAGDRVGGQWVLNSSSGMSACYRSVVVNTHRDMLKFSDFSPAPSYPDFPDHRQMAAYFASYADHFDLYDAIQLGTRVASARPTPDGRWQIDTDQGSGGTFDSLVVAPGRYGKPVWPKLAGDFDGAMLHAKQYMDPDDPVSCRDRNVLIIGLGNTACDLAVELSTAGAARRVLLSARSGQYIMPRYLNGKLSQLPHPADPLHPALRLIPPPLRNPFMRAVSPSIFRMMTRGMLKPQDVGLPAPQDPPNPRNIVCNDYVLEGLRDGAIEARPEVRALSGL